MSSRSGHELRDEEKAVSAALRSGVWLSIGLVVGALVWAWFGRLDVVSVATGEVIPSSQVKLVQHLEGGLVADILVREGDLVSVGQALIELETIAPDSDVEQMALRIEALTVDVARLSAEVNGLDDIVFPTGTDERYAEAAQQARDLFKARRSRINEQLAVQRAVILQRESEITEIRARLTNNKKRLSLLRRQVKISNELMKDQLTNEMLHLNLLKESVILEGEIAADEAGSKRAEAAFESARRSLSAIEAGYQQDVREALDEKRRALAETEQRLRKMADTLGRAVLRAPVDGVVKRLHVATRGGVVQPGQTVIERVPAEDRLIIEAQLQPQEIGYVRPGQDATLRLASSDGAHFGAIQGVVDFISPDTIEDPDIGAYYKVRIITEETAFKRGESRYQLVPGVQITSAILTGERSVMDYLLAPFLASAGGALRER